MKQILITVFFALAGSQAAMAQSTATPSEALSACVSSSMTSSDSVVAARWLFIAMSRHPSLPQGARLSDAEGLQANREMGALVNRMLFEACHSETRAAFEAHGQEAALDAAFNTVGEKAMTDLMGNADVMASVMQLGAYIDHQRFNALTTAPTP